MRKISVNPILVLIIILLTAVVFFSSQSSAQNKLTLEQRVKALESAVTSLQEHNREDHKPDRSRN